MDRLTNEQKEQEIQKFETRQNKRLLVGKIIIISIASVNIALSILSAIANLNIISLIIQIIFSIALLSGVTWVRYFFAIGAVINTFIILYTLLVVAAEVSLPTATTIVLYIQLAYFLASCILLFVSKCVSEYMYAKKNG